MAASNKFKRKADQLAGIFEPAERPKLGKLPFKVITKAERASQIKSEEIDHTGKADKLKAEVMETNQGSIEKDIAQAWGLTLPRPPRRPSRGGPKPKSEKWLQGLYDYRSHSESEIIHTTQTNKFLSVLSDFEGLSFFPQIDVRGTAFLKRS